MTDPAYADSDGNKVTLAVMCMREPAWAANRVREGEKALAPLAKLKGLILKTRGNHRHGAARRGCFVCTLIREMGWGVQATEGKQG